MFPNQELESFISDYAEPFYSCMRCGRTTPYSKHNLSKVLTQLQDVAGKNELAYPIELAYEFFETKTEEIEVAHWFSQSTKKVKKFGDVKLFIHFKKELTEEDITQWGLIIVGVYASLKAFCKH